MNNNASRAAAMGGLSGAVFLIGLAIAIASGHFLPVFFITIGLTSFIGSLTTPDPHANVGGFQGFIFFLGLALCTIFGWWPWILVVLGVSALVGSLHMPIVAGLSNSWRPANVANQPHQPEQQPYQPYKEGYQSAPSPATYQEGSSTYQYQPEPSEPVNYEQPQAQYPRLQEMPPQE